MPSGGGHLGACTAKLIYVERYPAPTTAFESCVRFLNGNSRIVFVLALLAVHASVWFGARKRFAVHGILMTLATTGITALFVAGVIARGLMGSVGKVDHGTVFYVALIVHVLSGGCFLIMAAFMLLPTGRKSLATRSRDASRHPALGVWAVRAITLSVLCLVVM
jgi:uncharacterized membrane protein YozB (DUF420 family)